MPVDTTHPDWDAMAPSWRVMDDVLGGEFQVKTKSDEYLPMLAEQDTLEYQRYLLRASFFNATGRTREALIGFLFRKDPQIKCPGIGMDKKEPTKNPALKSFVADATLSGKSFYDVAKQVSEEICGKGRYLTIIDWNEGEAQPYCVNYLAEDIINWNFVRRGGKTVLGQLVLHEMSSTYIALTSGVKPPDSYKRTLYHQWREWKLEDDGQGGEYVSVTTWRLRENRQSTLMTKQDLKGTGAAPGAQVESKMEDFLKVGYEIPMRRNQPLNEIPAVFHGPTGPFGAELSRPPLMDMAMTNLSHYRTSADLENVRHFMGSPMFWAAGFAFDQGSMHIGSSEVLVSPEPNARCGVLAIKGEDLKALTNALEEKERHMAALGARMLDAQHALGRSPEAYATVALRQTGETAVLLRISLALTQSLTDVLAWGLWWTNAVYDGIEDAELDCSYTLNTDFLGTMLDPASVQAFVAAWLQNAISFETLFQRLQQGELIPPDISVDEEKQRIRDGQDIHMIGVAMAQKAMQGAGEGGKGKGAAPGGAGGAGGGGTIAYRSGGGTSDDSAL